MKIHAGMIEYLVKQQFKSGLEFIGSPDALVERIRLLRGRVDDSATLYIVERGSSQERLIRKTRKASAESSAAYSFLVVDGAQLLSALEEAFDAYARLQRWDERLVSLLNGDARLASFVEAGEELIPWPFALISQELLVIERSKTFSRGQSPLKFGTEYQMPVSHVGALVDSKDYHAALDMREPYYFPLTGNKKQDYVVNIALGNKYIGSLVVDLPAESNCFEQGLCQIIQHFSHYLSVAYLRFSGNAMTSQSQNDAVHKMAFALMEGEDEPRDEIMSQALEMYGWQAKSLYSVIKLNFTERSKWDVASLYVARLLESNWPHTCAVIRGRSIVWIVNESKRTPSEDCDEAHGALPQGSRIPLEMVTKISEGHACHAGISEMFFDFHNLNAYVKQADLALEIGRLKSPLFKCCRFSDCKRDYLFDLITRDFTAEQMCHRGLLQLRAHDSLNGTDYYNCLKLYLELDKNVTHTAQALFVHRTTLLRWLEKIRAIAGINWDDKDELFMLTLSFALMDRVQ